MARSKLRPRGFDDLGLRRALSDRLLPLLVGAMAFLAALALAGAVAAASLAAHWREGAGTALTVQVPRPGEPADGAPGNRLDDVVAALRGTPGVAQARPLSDAELADLLRPWLGADAEQLSLPLPGVVAVRLTAPDVDLTDAARHVDVIAPGTLVERHDVWVRRLTALARSLQACAGLALVVVALVAVAVIAVATRAGLAARRDAIDIVHGLGATDAYIAGRFAGRVTLLATLGALAGAVVALPVLLALSGLAAPLAGWGAARSTSAAAAAATGIGWLADMPIGGLPPPIWFGLPALPVAAAIIGWLTAQGTVRTWLRRLP